MKKSKQKKPANDRSVLQEMRKIGGGIERRLGVKIEDVEHKVDLVIERQDGMDSRLDEVDSKLGNLENKVDKMAADIDVIKLDIEFIKNDLKKKVGLDEFVALERRVALLERRA